MSFGGFSGSGGGSGGTSGAGASAAAAGGGSGMNMQQMLAKLGGMFGGQKDEQEPAAMADPGAASAALAAQLVQALPQLMIRRPNMGLGRR